MRTFRTDTGQLLAVADWPTDERVTHVAMESTGAYWKPIWNLFEGCSSCSCATPSTSRRCPAAKRT